MVEPIARRLSDTFRVDAASEAARDAVRVVTSSALAVVDTVDELARTSGRGLARRLGVPTRADVDRLATAVTALQTAVSELASPPPSPGRRS